MGGRWNRIRGLLLEEGLVTAEDWDSAGETGRPPVDILLERGRLEEEHLYRVLSQASSVPAVDLARVEPDSRAVDALSQEACVEKCVLPLARAGENLTVAVPDPFDLLLFDDLRALTGLRILPVLSHPAAIRVAQDELFDSGRRQIEELLHEVGVAEIEVAEESAEEIEIGDGSDDDDVPVVKLVNLIIQRALRSRASDVHIEPAEESIRVRYRVDGLLAEAMSPPKSLLASVLSRLKILANLDIAVRMESQDGKFQIRYEGRTIDIRLSTLPVVGGEKAVLRILDQSCVSTELDSLGFEERCLADIIKAVRSAYGMLLVTGPTGSGKSTTLHAALREVSTPEVNAVTVEDPVEYRLEGVNQVSVHPRRGVTFASALRSILRQDPDVILVGEIRDRETAEIAVKAALTGHLVLSTLHTNDAVGAVTRLGDMGIDLFKVSSSVNCVAAQRLVRRLCTHCREVVELPEGDLISMGLLESDIDGQTIYQAKSEGCARCRGGYRGRFALLETLPLDPEIRRMIIDGKSAQDIKSAGIAAGMLTLRRVGLLNARRGRTSLEEVLRVTIAEEEA